MEPQPDLNEFADETSKLVKTSTADPSDKLAHLKALTAARQLVRELETDDDAWSVRIQEAGLTHVLRWLMHLNVHKSIPLDDSISGQDLATKVNADVEFLTRFMRFACSCGIFKETSDHCYAHTKLSRALVEPSYGAYFEMFLDDLLLKTFARFPEYYSSRPLVSPNDPYHNPFAWAFDMDGHPWSDVIGRDAASYEKFLVGMNGNWAHWPSTGIYPWDEGLAQLSEQAVAEDSIFMVDVGGSQGFMLKQLRDNFPMLNGKMVVQDIASVINAIPEGSLPPEIEPQVHDFWTPQPVKRAKVYHMRRIMHDWPDAECQKILRHLADAMTPDSKLLIADMVIPETPVPEDAFAYCMDLCMMLFAGRERTMADWQSLFDSSGLEFVKLWQGKTGTQSVLEARKKPC